MKKYLKKSLAIFLTVVLLVTTVSVGFGALAATITKTDDAIIAVPETVYMTPSTGASTLGKYYVNNTINSAKNGVDLEVNNANGNGRVQLSIPGAKSFTVQVNTITNGIGDIVLANAGATSGTRENSTTFNFDSNGMYDENGVGFYISGTGITAGNTALAEWIFTVTMNNGSV